MTETEIRKHELPINRAIYWMRQGVSSENIDASRIGVTEDELPEILAAAKIRMVENDKSYAEMTRKGAFGFIGFGLVMLALAFYLAQGDVPLLRQGRLVFAFIMGGVSLSWGLFRYFNHNSKYEF